MTPPTLEGLLLLASMASDRWMTSNEVRMVARTAGEVGGSLKALVNSGLVERSSRAVEGRVKVIATWRRTPAGDRMANLSALALYSLAFHPEHGPEATDALRLLWTDPPYGVAYVGKTKDALKIANDDLDPEKLRVFLDRALSLAVASIGEGSAVYVAAPGGPLNVVFGLVLERLGVYRQGLTWAKDTFALGRSDYHYRHEPIFYGWRPGGPHRWYGGRHEDTVHNHPKPARSRVHPTMKPVGLIARHISNSSRVGETVLDCFGGSGSTLIACALTERRARLIELSPGYCDVIRRRWTRWAKSRGLPVGSGGLDG